MPLLQRSSVTFYEKGGCVSCHHNLLGLMTAQTLRRQGLPLDEKIAASELRVLAEDMATSRDQALQGIVVPGGLFTTTGYVLISLAAAGHPADASTDALVRLLRRGQFPDGRWVSPVRPPSEASVFTATAVSLRGIQLYGNPRSAADRAAIASASRLAAQGDTGEHRGCDVSIVRARAGRTRRAQERRAAIDALLAAQKADGGWAQLDYRASDAYATGQVLVALHEAGVSGNHRRISAACATCSTRNSRWFVARATRARCPRRSTSRAVFRTARTSSSRRPGPSGRRRRWRGASVAEPRPLLLANQECPH